jgi:hypothetical protein
MDSSSLLSHIQKSMENKVRKTTSGETKVIRTDSSLDPSNRHVLIIKRATVILPSVDEMIRQHPGEEAITLNLYCHTDERIIIKAKDGDSIHINSQNEQSEGTSASNGRGKFVTALVIVDNQTTVTLVYDLEGSAIFCCSNL